MNSNLNRETAQMKPISPSTFGMPACGHADVRIQADMGLAVRTYAPGPYAWRPPTS